jgi:SAM-dependent methyltransferase
MPSYYSDKLSAQRLRACYDLSPPRTKAYLEAEIEFVLQKTSSSMAVLELGCGYGRVLRHLLPRARTVVGIDTSIQSLRTAAEFVGRTKPVRLAAMDAAQMGFQSQSLDRQRWDAVSAYRHQPLALCPEHPDGDCAATTVGSWSTSAIDRCRCTRPSRADQSG